MLQNERKQGAFPDEFGKNCGFNPFPMKNHRTYSFENSIFFANMAVILQKNIEI